MTPEQIALEAIFPKGHTPSKDWPDGLYQISGADLIATLRQAILDEREACAKIAETCASSFEQHAERANTSMNRALNKLGACDCKHVANAIRGHP